MQTYWPITRTWPRFGLSRWGQWLWLLHVPFIVALSLMNLDRYPTINGWDEGIYLQFAQNLAQHGEYATRSQGVFERLMPAGGTGPSLIGPVAAALAVNTHSLVSARLVITVYLWAALLCALLFLQVVGSRWAAALGLPLFMMAGYGAYDTVWLGRQILAEIPALAFGLGALLAWVMSWSRGRAWLAASAVLAGLAAITKNQLIWTLAPALIVLAVIDKVYYHQLRWAQSVAPLAGLAAGYGAWLAASVWIVGPEGRAAYLETQSALAAASFLHVSVSRSLECLRLFYHSGQWPLALAAIGYGLYAARRRNRAGLARLVLPCLVLVALANFLVASVPWARYLHLPLALAMLCAALAGGDLIRWAEVHWGWGLTRAAIAILTVVIILTGPQLIGDFRRIVAEDDQRARRFAGLLDQELAGGAAVLNWEWELEFFSAHDFVHPPFRLFPAMVDAMYNGRQATILAAPRIPAGVDYLVIGPFAQQTQAFAQDLSNCQGRLLLQDGPYALYALDGAPCSAPVPRSAGQTP